MWERKLEEAKAARAERYPETAQELTIKGWISALEWVLEKKK
ncbi:unnamed protein product [marine sediment metagenome]|uniref:Uncharacterized protein n=1 Tax=marine sediment metagenome TaxID=412755 RepID=X1JIJ2_9ZZZZ